MPRAAASGPGRGGREGRVDLAITCAWIAAMSGAVVTTLMVPVLIVARKRTAEVSRWLWRPRIGGIPNVTTTMADGFVRC